MYILIIDDIIANTIIFAIPTKAFCENFCPFLLFSSYPEVARTRLRQKGKTLSVGKCYDSWPRLRGYPGTKKTISKCAALAMPVPASRGQSLFKIKATAGSKIMKMVGALSNKIPEEPGRFPIESLPPWGSRCRGLR